MCSIANGKSKYLLICNVCQEYTAALGSKLDPHLAMFARFVVCAGNEKSSRKHI